MKKRTGQILVGVIALLVVLAIVIPAMVRYVQNESRWSVKEQQNTNAFQLAEAAVDRAYQKIVESTGTWIQLQAGQRFDGFKFDTAYSDIPGGTYAIMITSGPEEQQATIIGVGRDKNNKETRALKVVYANATMSETAIRSLAGITLSGSNEQVEWGGVMAPGTINTNNRNHPQFHSAGAVLPQDGNGSEQKNTDSVQWWSYFPGIPPASDIALDTYLGLSTGTNTHYVGDQSWGKNNTPCNNATKCDTGYTYYIDGNLNIDANGIYVRGNLIVTGNLTLPSGQSGQGSPTVKLPRLAWKQYGNDWDFYKNTHEACQESWEDTTPGRPVNFPGLNSSYKSDATITKTFTKGKVVVNGFLYVGKTLTDGGGGGGASFVGAAYVVGPVNFTSNNNCFFYTKEAASQILTTNVLLSRESWQDSKQRWPLP